MQADIRDRPALDQIFAAHRPDAVMHLAAESRVDRSIDGHAHFIETNVTGTLNQLEASARPLAGGRQARGLPLSPHLDRLGLWQPRSRRQVHASRALRSAPYSASDHIVRGWGKTYGLPVLVTNCSNNYRPLHFPEKLIPVVILRALAGEPIPVHCVGSNVRDWLFVEDHADALLTVL